MENQFMEIIKNAYGMQDGKYIIRIFRGRKVETETEIESHVDNHCEIKWDHAREVYAFKYPDADHHVFYSPKVLQHYMDNWIAWGDLDNDGIVCKWQIVQLP